MRKLCRSRRLRRQRQNQANALVSAGSPGQANGAAGTNGARASLDYSAFKIIVDRNIFDPNRFPHAGPRPIASKPKSFDSVTLVGTMSYEKGTFAFFDGTSSEYKKALKLTDSIAGYRVTNIAPNAVKLATGTNEVELSVGGQLRREENGPWLLAGQSMSYASTPGSTSASGAASTTTAGSAAAASGADSDIIKKLMQRREKE